MDGACDTHLRDEKVTILFRKYEERMTRGKYS
jgi:hypothetical protein